MRIRRLSLHNYRGFSDTTVDLDRPVTVLAGVNGSGKSSILVGAATVLSRVLLYVDQGKRRATWSFETVDLHEGSDSLSVEGLLANGGQEVPIRAGFRRGDPQQYPPIIPSVATIARAAPCLPVFYTAARNAAHGSAAFITPPPVAGEPPHARPDIYDALDPGGVGGGGFASFFRWFKEREDVENEARVAKKDLALEDPQLGAVRRAVTGMLPGFAEPRIQRDPLHLLVRKGDLTLAIDQLSDGEKLWLTMTADLARRLSIAHADSPDPLEGEAIVLIDEIEQHLHPAWQRTAIGNLRATFPGCQFIVTTHSPIVLGSVPRDAVLLLDHFEVVRPGAPTQGRDTNAILAEVMGVPERPDDVAEEIRTVDEWLDDSELERARGAVARLEERLGWQDAEVIRLKTRLEFLERPLLESSA